jgi:hypothetical protein
VLFKMKRYDGAFDVLKKAVVISGQDRRTATQLFLANTKSKTTTPRRRRLRARSDRSTRASLERRIKRYGSLAALDKTLDDKMREGQGLRAGCAPSLPAQVHCTRVGRLFTGECAPCVSAVSA